jgi:hypothetical protein
MLPYLADLLRPSDSHTSHEVMMAREVLCSRIVDDVDAELERPLEVGRHHGVVEDNDGVLQRRDRATKEGKENYHQLVVDFVSGNRQGREEGRWMRCSRRLPLSFVQGLTSDSASSSLYGRPSHLPPLLHLTSNSSCGTIPPSLVADHHCKPKKTHGSTLPDEVNDGLDVCDLEHGVRGRFEEDHRDVVLSLYEERLESIGMSGIDVMNFLLIGTGRAE